MRPIPLFSLLAGISLALSTLTATAEEASFTVSLRGLNAGQLSFQASESGGTYSVKGQAAPVGLARTLYPASASAAVSGRIDGNRYYPQNYAEIVNKRDETKRAEYAYSGGVPKVTQNPPDTKRKPYHAKAKDQKGTVDPLTAIFAILRDRPADLVCDLDISSFDGRERSRVRMAGGKRDGDKLICPGMYTRVAGYSPKEMAEKPNWPFTVFYRIGDDGIYRVERFEVPTSLGTAVFRRQ